MSFHQPALGLGAPVPRLGGRSLSCPRPTEQLPPPHTGLPRRMQPGQSLPSICTSSRCLPAAPSPVCCLSCLCSHSQGCCTGSLPSGSSLHCCLAEAHFTFVATSLLLAGRLQAAPHQPQPSHSRRVPFTVPSRVRAIACRAAQEGEELADGTAEGQGTLDRDGAGLTCSREVPTQPAFPTGCSTAETSPGAERRETPDGGTAWRRAVNTHTRGCCHQPSPSVATHGSSVSGAMWHSCGAAPLPGSPRCCQAATTLPLHCHRPGLSRQPVSTSATLRPAQPCFWGQQPHHHVPTWHSHHCLPPQVPFPTPWHPQAGATPRRPLIGCRAGPGSLLLRQVTPPRREGAPRVLGSGWESPPVPLSSWWLQAGGCSIALILGCNGVVWVWSQKCECPGMS